MDSDVLKKLQKEQFDIAKKVTGICDKYNLQYFLIGGTLLGAVRHGGFIPWDDDFDIGMPRKDYEQFLEISQVELGNDYYLHAHETDKEYWLPFAKVRRNGTLFNEKSIMPITTHKGIFIDIFPFDNVISPGNKLLPVLSKIIGALSVLIYRKRGLDLGVKPNIKQKILLFFTKLMTIKKLAYFQRKLMTLYDNRKTEYWINWGSYYGYKKEMMPKEKFLPLTKLSFDGATFKVPKDHYFVLTQIFGDYMVPPPIEQRTGQHAVEIAFNEDDPKMNI